MSDIGGFHRVGGEDIEIVRRRASSKAECELITSDLGKRATGRLSTNMGIPGWARRTITPRSLRIEGPFPQKKSWPPVESPGTKRKIPAGDITA